jgi:hypothetical protein
LNLCGTAHRVYDAAKFRQEAIAGVLYGTAPVLLDLRINQLTEMRLEPFVRPFLVRSHQARIARHIGGEDRGKTACRGHGCGSPPCPVRLAYHTAQSPAATYARTGLTAEGEMQAGVFVLVSADGITGNQQNDGIEVPMALANDVLLIIQGITPPADKSVYP